MVDQEQNDLLEGREHRQSKMFCFCICLEETNYNHHSSITNGPSNALFEK